jgi:hypothetical protein
MKSPSIKFTPELLRKLKEQYRKAREEHLEQFKFEGHDLLTDYAKYLIMYVEMQLASKQRVNL